MKKSFTYINAMFMAQADGSSQPWFALAAVMCWELGDRGIQRTMNDLDRSQQPD